MYFIILAAALAVPSPADASASSNAVTSSADLSDIQKALQSDTSEAAPQAAAPTQPSSGGQQGANVFNPAIAVILDVAAARFSDVPDELGGHDPSHNGFNLQQVELSFESNVDPYFAFHTFIVFKDAVEVEEAVATTTSLPYNLQLRAGRFLNRFGRLNATHPHSWDFADQPLVIGKFFGEDGNRGIGLEPSVLLPLPWYAEVVGSAIQPDEQATNRSFVGATERNPDRLRELLYTGALKQFWNLSDDIGLNLGLSGAQGPGFARADKSQVFGSDLYLKWRPISQGIDEMSLSLQAEWVGRHRDWSNRVLNDQGGYAQLVYHYDRRWATGIRAERVSGLKSDPLDPAWDSPRLRNAAQITYSPTEFSRIRLQENRDRIPGQPNPVWGTFLAFEVAVGAHGAHAY
jgi:hypothetical protein